MLASFIQKLNAIADRLELTPQTSGKHQNCRRQRGKSSQTPIESDKMSIVQLSQREQKGIVHLLMSVAPSQDVSELLRTQFSIGKKGMAAVEFHSFQEEETVQWTGR